MNALLISSHFFYLLIRLILLEKKISNILKEVGGLV
jgi:hypothetical protein